MCSIETGYDLLASKFSPDGRVFQEEYAVNAVENSGVIVGIRGKNGVVFGVEKLILSKLCHMKRLPVYFKIYFKLL